MDFKRGNRICFTYNLEPEEEFVMPDSAFYHRYVYQQEVAPTTGQPHIQGYIEFTKQMRFAEIQRLMPHNHFEKCRGSWKQNFAYCTKKESRLADTLPIKFGDWEKLTEGLRNHLTDCLDTLKVETSLDKVIHDFPATFARYSSNLKNLHRTFHYSNIRRNVDWVDVDYRWYVGKTGTGKTQRVYWEFGQEVVFKKTSTSKWWDGYDPLVHKVILIDDYRDNKDLPFQELLTIMDVYPIHVEVKGSTLPFAAPVVIVTSNHTPREIWPDKKIVDLEAIYRRLNGVLYDADDNFNKVKINFY